jgi:hypothetical protein
MYEHRPPPHLMFLYLRLFLFNYQFQWFEANTLSVKYSQFKIFIILVFRSTASQRNLKLKFDCILSYKSTL